MSDNEKATDAKCDGCGKVKRGEFLTEINPEGGFGRPRYILCDACLDAAPDGSYTAEVRDNLKAQNGRS